MTLTSIETSQRLRNPTTKTSPLSRIPSEIVFIIAECIDEWDDVLAFRLAFSRDPTVPIPQSLRRKHEHSYAFQIEPTTKLYRNVTNNSHIATILKLARIRNPSKLQLLLERQQTRDFEIAVVAALSSLSRTLRDPAKNNMMLHEYNTASNREFQHPLTELAVKVVASLRHGKKQSSAIDRRQAEPWYFVQILRCFDLQLDFENQLRGFGLKFIAAWGNCTLRVNHLARVKEVFGGKHTGCRFLHEFVASELCRVGIDLCNLPATRNEGVVLRKLISFSRFLDFVQKLEKLYREFK